MKSDAFTEAAMEELLKEEIPCGNPGCGRPAQLRSSGHCCPNPSPGLQGCLPCWQEWLRLAVTTLTVHGFIGCIGCGRHFYTVESFSDYRPF